jgi:hypothetical protein
MLVFIGHLLSVPAFQPLRTASNIFCSKNYEKFGHPFVMGGSEISAINFSSIDVHFYLIVKITP